MHIFLIGPADLCLRLQVSLPSSTRTNLLQARRSQSRLTVPQDLQIFWHVQIDAKTACVSELLPCAGGGGIPPRSFRCRSCSQHHPRWEPRVFSCTSKQSQLRPPTPLLGTTSVSQKYGHPLLSARKSRLTANHAGISKVISPAWNALWDTPRLYTGIYCGEAFSSRVRGWWG